MKAVDWILELPDRIYFIEVKDPDAPEAKHHSQRNDFLRRFRASKLTSDLVVKFRDSFLYEWACNRVDKPISYYVIVASDTLDDALLLSRTDDLKSKLPVGKLANWTRAVAHNCGVFNIAKWNDVFREYPLLRDSVTGHQPSDETGRGAG